MYAFNAIDFLKLNMEGDAGTWQSDLWRQGKAIPRSQLLSTGCQKYLYSLSQLTSMVCPLSSLLDPFHFDCTEIQGSHHWWKPEGCALDQVLLHWHHLCTRLKLAHCGWSFKHNHLDIWKCQGPVAVRWCWNIYQPIGLHSYEGALWNQRQSIVCRSPAYSTPWTTPASMYRMSAVSVGYCTHKFWATCCSGHCHWALPRQTWQVAVGLPISGKKQVWRSSFLHPWVPAGVGRSWILTLTKAGLCKSLHPKICMFNKPKSQAKNKFHCMETILTGSVDCLKETLVHGYRAPGGRLHMVLGATQAGACRDGRNRIWWKKYEHTHTHTYQQNSIMIRFIYVYVYIICAFIFTTHSSPIIYSTHNCTHVYTSVYATYILWGHCGRFMHFSSLLSVGTSGRLPQCMISAKQAGHHCMRSCPPIPFEKL